MFITRKALLSHTASDVMSRTLVLLPKDMSLQGAAHRLLQADVHGAPVVDDQGHCVGVLSTMDFLGWAEKKKASTDNEKKNYFSPWQMVDPSKLPADEVARFMTPDPVTVAPMTSIKELARMMLDAHIHRLIVVEEEGRPVGIVSCTDILAAVAFAEAD